MRWVWLLAALSACSFHEGALPPDGQRPADMMFDVAEETFGWSTPMEIAELHNGELNGNDDPSLTNDLLEIYYGSRQTGGLGAEDIWMASRTSVSQPFGTPVNVTVLNSSGSETTMKVTGDGLAIFFASDRLGGTNDTEIFASTRASRTAAWSTPVKVDVVSVAGTPDWAAFAQPNLLHLIMCSGTSEADEALYTSDRTSQGMPWSPRVKVASLDEAGKSECDPIEPTPYALYYSSDYLATTTTGRFDIFRANRLSDTNPYGGRTPLSINMPGVNDRDPWVSPDERTLVFASDRNGVNFQIYISKRQ